MSVTGADSPPQQVSCWPYLKQVLSNLTSYNKIKEVALELFQSPVFWAITAVSIAIGTLILGIPLIKMATFTIVGVTIASVIGYTLAETNENTKNLNLKLDQITAKMDLLKSRLL